MHCLGPHLQIYRDLYNPNLIPSSALKLASILNMELGETRLVGGYIRDSLLASHNDLKYSNLNKDLDLATVGKAEEIIKVFKRYDIKVILTSLKYGTVTAVLDSERVEITSLRVDTQCYGRDADVTYTSDWAEDARRRDFSINALYMDTEGNIYDYYNGFSDLQAGTVRFIGNAEERIKEDYLRILRYFRFCTYLGNEPEYPTLRIIGDLVEHLSELSGERIKREMFKLLSIPYSSKTLARMCVMGIFPFIQLSIPFVSPERLAHLSFGQDPLINLAAIIYISGADQVNITKLARDWQLTKREASILYELCQSELTISLGDDYRSHIRYIQTLEQDSYLRYLAMLKVLYPSYSQRYHELTQLAKNHVKSSLPITGNDLMKLGLTGKEIGDKLNLARKMWLASQCTLTSRDLIKIIQH